MVIITRSYDSDAEIEERNANAYKVKPRHNEEKSDFGRALSPLEIKLKGIELREAEYNPFPYKR